MKCEECYYNNRLVQKNGKYEISCSKNGSFVLSSDYEENFDCPLFETSSGTEQDSLNTDEPNCIVILKSGRDIAYKMSEEEKEQLFSKNVFNEFNEFSSNVMNDGTNFILCREVAAIHLL